MANLVSQDVRGAYEKALARYRPGGEYGKGVEAALERGRVKSVATGAQSLVSAGLAGTTVIAGLGKKYEEEVAAPTRARVEETRAERMSAIEMALANIMQRSEELQKQGEMQREEMEARKAMQTQQLAAQERTAFYGRRAKSRAAGKAKWAERSPWMAGKGGAGAGAGVSQVYPDVGASYGARGAGGYTPGIQEPAMDQTISKYQQIAKAWIR